LLDINLHNIYRWQAPKSLHSVSSFRHEYRMS